MIHDGLMAESATIYPDLKQFYVCPVNVDECPPYIVLNLISGTPEHPGGDVSRYQITGVSTDVTELETMMAAIKELFHDKGGMYGDVAISSMGCVLESPVSRDDNGVYSKSIDLKIFTR